MRQHWKKDVFMKYYVRINKRLRYIKVYSVINPIGKKQNFMTKLFMKAFRVNPEQPAKAPS